MAVAEGYHARPANPRRAHFIAMSYGVEPGMAQTDAD